MELYRDGYLELDEPCPCDSGIAFRDCHFGRLKLGDENGESVEFEQDEADGTAANENTEVVFAVATTLRATTRSFRASTCLKWSIQSRECLHRRCGVELDPYGCCSHIGKGCCTHRDKCATLRSLLVRMSCEAVCLSEVLISGTSAGDSILTVRCVALHTARAFAV